MTKSQAYTRYIEPLEVSSVYEHRVVAKGLHYAPTRSVRNKEQFIIMYANGILRAAQWLLNEVQQNKEGV